MVVLCIQLSSIQLSINSSHIQNPHSPHLFSFQGLLSPVFSKTGFQKSYHDERLLSTVFPPSELTPDDWDLGLPVPVRAKAAFDSVPGVTELDLFGLFANL